MNEADLLSEHMAPEAIAAHVPGRTLAMGRLAPKQPAEGCPPVTAELHGQTVHHAQDRPVWEEQAGNGSSEPLLRPR